MQSSGLSFAGRRWSSQSFQYFVEPDRLVASAFDGHVCVSPGGVILAVQVPVDVDRRHGPPTERKVRDGGRGIGVEDHRAVLVGEACRLQLLALPHIVVPSDEQPLARAAPHVVHVLRISPEARDGDVA